MASLIEARVCSTETVGRADGMEASIIALKYSLAPNGQYLFASEPITFLFIRIVNPILVVRQSGHLL